jgi:predicted transposase YbfD/YdcC
LFRGLGFDHPMYSTEKELGMDVQAPVVFLRCFSGLTDPRRHNIRHLFSDILSIAILAVMCRSDDWDEVVLYGNANLQWLGEFLELPNGIPSADTFSRLFARINPDAFEKCFIEWTQSLASSSEGRLVAVDGKSLRRSFLHGWNKQMVHMVSAWCGQNELALGQLAVDGKSNEITAIPKLLELLNLKKAVVSADAMGCQKEIAAQIRLQGGDYLLGVKDNQQTLHEKARGILTDIALDQAKGLNPDQYDYHEKTEAGHGRIETRRVWATTQVKGLGKELLAQWPDLNSLVMVENQRQDLGNAAGKVTVERGVFICSLKNPSAEQAGGYVRQHWGVENQLHWRLDMCYREDESRIRKDYGAENFSRLRRITMNKLKSDPKKMSLKCKRYKCSLDREYLIKMLQQ